MGLVAQNGVAYIVVVGRLHIVEKDDVFQLHGVAHHAARAHQRAAADKGAVAHLGVGADDAGAGDGGGGGDVRRLMYPDLRGKGQVVAVQRRAQRADTVRQPGERLPGVGKAGKILPCQRVRKIIEVGNGVHGVPPECGWSTVREQHARYSTGKMNFSARNRAKTIGAAMRKRLQFL